MIQSSIVSWINNFIHLNDISGRESAWGRRTPSSSLWTTSSPPPPPPWARCTRWSSLWSCQSLKLMLLVLKSKKSIPLKKSWDNVYMFIVQGKWHIDLKHWHMLHNKIQILLFYIFHWEVLVSMCFQDIHGIGCIYIYPKSLRTLVWHLYLFKRVHPACGSSNLTSFRSTMRRTSSSTLPTPMSQSMATSRCSSDFYVSVNFWLNLALYQSMWFYSREGWTKNWNGKSTLALSFYFWQFCTGEWWS